MSAMGCRGGVDLGWVSYANLRKLTKYRILLRLNNSYCLLERDSGLSLAKYFVININYRPFDSYLAQWCIQSENLIRDLLRQSSFGD